MIYVDAENNITISQGDTFAVEFEIDEPLAYGDKAVLAIKKGAETLMSIETAGEGITVLSFVISKDEMRNLGVGKYVYDLHFDYANGVRFTADFVRKLEILQVAHEV